MDFFCEQHRCDMSIKACMKRQGLVNGRRIGMQDHRSITTTMIAPELCIDCPQGLLNIDVSQGIAARQETEKPVACLWLDCDKPVEAGGLCKKHYQQARRNALIKINTKGASAGALWAFLADLVAIADKNNLPAEDVAIACMFQGVQQYIRREGLQPQSNQDQHTPTGG